MCPGGPVEPGVSGLIVCIGRTIRKEVLLARAPIPSPFGWSAIADYDVRGVVLMLRRPLLAHGLEQAGFLEGWGQ